MDPILYKAAMEGNIGDGNFVLADHLLRDEENGYQVTATKGNTILHVAALYGHSHFVEEVLKITPGLLCHQNKIRKETALHIAANEGNTEVVRMLISKAGEEKETLMRMTDDNGDNALHKAVWKDYLDVAKILVKEDPEYEFPANKAGETPIYLAVQSGFHDILVEILESSTKPNYSASAPVNQTPLHVAVIQEHTDCATLLLQWNKSLCEEADTRGWIPLHYAVALGLKELVSDMLGWKRSLGYLRAGSDNDWTTIFHIAAGAGHVDIIKELSEDYPEFWEMVNSSGQNVLHVAVSNKKFTVAFFLHTSKNCYFLVKELDKDGNLPSSFLPVARAKKMTLNKKNRNLDDIASSCTGASKKEDELDPKFEKGIDHVLKIIQMHLVVATLVMTVTFAAGFTLPGGFDSDAGPNKGMAILTRKAAFRAFVVTDSIAFTLSASAIFIYYSLAVLTNVKLTANLVYFIVKLYAVAGVMQLFAMLAVVIAFVTGMYATLAHSVGLAGTVCIIGCTSFPIFFWVLRQQWRAI